MKMNDINIEAVNLGEMRITMGLSRREVAEISGITQARIWKLEHATTWDDEMRKNGIAIYNSLGEWFQANPDGKPKKTTKSSSTEGDLSQLSAQVADLMKHSDETSAFLIKLRALVEEQITVTKSKKQSTAPLKTVFDTLDTWMQSN